MGIIDNIINAVTGKDGATSMLSQEMLKLFGGDNGSALSSLAQSFKQSGLGDIADSWISKGKNLPVTAEQLIQAIGPKVKELAAQKGLSTEHVSKALAQFLPGLVDKLTPNGELPKGS